MTGFDLDLIAELDDVIVAFRTAAEDKTRKIICPGCFPRIFRGFWPIAQHNNTTRCIDILPTEMLQKLCDRIGCHYSFQQTFQEPHHEQDAHKRRHEGGPDTQENKEGDARLHAPQGQLDFDDSSVHNTDSEEPLRCVQVVAMGAIVAKKRRRWGPLIGDDPFSLAETAGRVGLRNLGNTCFMNAGLQCLSHIEPFVAYFLTGKYREEINRTNPLSSKGALASAIAGLQQALWQARLSSHNPKDLHRVLRSCAPHLFEGYEQQDVQEFLAFCLDGLHEDLNLVAAPPRPDSEETEAEDAHLAVERGEEFAAALSWMRYLERGKSFLVDLFQGQLRSSVTCAECGCCKRRFEPFLYLSVPVTRSMTQVSDAIGKFQEEELLTEDERWLCPQCDRKVNAVKKIDIWKLPPVLVMHLKRFEFDARTFQFRKVRSLLSTPLTVDFSPYVSSPQREHATYDMVAVANHHGAFGSGHYTAYCRVTALVGGRADEEGASSSGVCDEWYDFNDDRVSRLGQREVISKDSYVMFLIRHAGEGQQIKRQTVSLPEVWPHCVSTRNSALHDVLHGSTGAGSSQDSAGKRPDGKCSPPEPPPQAPPQSPQSPKTKAPSAKRRLAGLLAQGRSPRAPQ